MGLYRTMANASKSTAIIAGRYARDPGKGSRRIGPRMARFPVGGTDQIQNYRNRVVAAVASGNSRDRCDLLLGDEQLTGIRRKQRDARLCRLELISQNTRNVVLSADG